MEASQDWHNALELMLNEEYIPEGVNLAQKWYNSAWRVHIPAYQRDNLAWAREYRHGPAGTY
jgi:hypothetical protein